MATHHEVEFEREICEHLAAHGWLYSENDEGYDRQRALYRDDVFAWLADTQPEAYAKAVAADADAAARLACFDARAASSRAPVREEAKAAAAPL
mgnify:CR=1 FL=1